MLSEERQTDKDKYYMISLYVEPKKNDANEPMVGRGWGAPGRMDWELGMDMYTLLYLKWMTNKGLQYSTGNSAQYSIIT